MKFKRKVFLVLTLMILLINVFDVPTEAKPKNNKSISVEEYSASIRLLLYPYLSKEVAHRYGEYAHVNTYDMDIIEITKENAKVKIDIIIRPFIGAHNRLSTDNVTILISSQGMEILDYRTIEN